MPSARSTETGSCLCCVTSPLKQCASDSEPTGALPGLKRIKQLGVSGSLVLIWIEADLVGPLRVRPKKLGLFLVNL